jgi:uncharacterized repeat protein (TIGR04076 family)
MPETYDIEITVTGQKGTCGAGHKVGDKWLIQNHTPGGICLSVYPQMHACIDVLKYGGTYPWNKDPDIDQVICPDPQNPVIFKLKRIRKNES